MKKMLHNEVGMKLLGILLLFVLLQLPMHFISDLVQERSERQQQVREDIARSSSGEQSIMGPFLLLNYRQTIMVDGKPRDQVKQKVILPNQFNFSADLKSFEKYRGIYTARLYHANTHLQGNFNLAPLADIPEDKIDKVSLVVVISDSRGINSISELFVGGEPRTVEPGTGLSRWAQGYHIPLTLEQLAMNKPLDFDIAMILQGMGSLQVTPVGKQTEVNLNSAWPHPSFIGDYLPIESQITEQGFSAKWLTNNLSSNINELFNQCLSRHEQCSALYSRQMGVDLIDPIDHYMKSYRATNYSLLVMTLVFACFFLLETIQARPIHPVQYGFVGLALAVFYLLLISFSEHLGFSWAYGVSAVASSGLLAIYVAGILNSKRQGTRFFAGIATLYALLFGLLKVESYALLLGTLLCFGVLSALMLLTRNINWYEKSTKIKPRERDEQC